MTLVVECEEHLEKVREFAVSVGARFKLEEQLNILGSYGENTRCRLYKDFAPNSFYFVMERKISSEYDTDEYKAVFNGGLIYSGPGCPADGSFPSLTVSLEVLDPCYNGSAHRWSIHT